MLTKYLITDEAVAYINNKPIALLKQAKKYEA